MAFSDNKARPLLWCGMDGAASPCPQLVVTAAEEMVGYLLGTQSLGLCYERCVGGRIDGALPLPMP